MIEVVREHVVHMLHTHDGSRVAMMCLWHGTAKVRVVLLVLFILVTSAVEVMCCSWAVFTITALCHQVNLVAKWPLK